MADAEPGRFRQLVRKRWRAWLRAIHRDIGYLAVGFTIIYAISGIAMNHIDAWDPSFRSTERTLAIQPIDDNLTDDEAVARVTAAAGLGKPDEVLRAGDEVRLEYEDGTKVTAIADTVTVQARDDRFFFRIAVWLHATRGKQAWKYIADAYAVLLLYLAISGIFMIKGKLGLRWRGTALIGVGLAAPVAYIVLSGGPGAQKPDTKLAKTNDSGIRMLSPDENADEDAPARPPERPAVRKTPPTEPR
ncbi:MAG TPA: hypothetical protein VFQ53_21595 [Kofleriaceae bacterium]|nr:hypothetical protein [Kofleriaceae bacterium]